MMENYQKNSVFIEMRLNIYGTVYSRCCFSKNIILIVGVKKESHKSWSMGIPEKSALVTGTALRGTGPVPTNSQQQ